jgi:hypothetical protein
VGEKRGACRVLVRKPEGKRPLERPRHRWENNIKINRKEIKLWAWSEFIWLRRGTSGMLF